MDFTLSIYKNLLNRRGDGASKRRGEKATKDKEKMKIKTHKNLDVYKLAFGSAPGNL